MNYIREPKLLPSEAIIEKLGREPHLSQTITTLLAQRGITTYDEAMHFFSPSLASLHDPFLMKDTHKAVARLSKAINTQEKILIYGDYDVDGTSAVSLLYRYLSNHISLLYTYVPDRYTEGYGISFQGVDCAVSKGCSLIIVLDCGIRAIDKVQCAIDKGIDFIIGDYHRPDAQVPDAVAILNPWQANCPYPRKELCGCGIGFKLVQVYQQHLSRPLEEIRPSLDSVAVVTAADIVAINGENRTLAYFSLEVINQQPSAGVDALLGESQRRVGTGDVVFKAAPRINAAGWIERGKCVVALLTETNSHKTKEKTYEIELLNSERKELDSSITQEALTQIGENGEQNRYSTVVFNPHWHKGVIGTVTSRLAETYYHPTLVFTQGGDKYAASARSITGFDIYDALEQCNKYLGQFGGHTYATGLTLLPEQYPDFKEAFKQVVVQKLANLPRGPKICYDTQLPLSKIIEKLIGVLKRFEPFGPNNLPPLFHTDNVIDTGFAKAIGKDEKHLELNLREVGCPYYFGTVAFDLAGRLPIVEPGRPFSIIYSIEENIWNGIIHPQLRIHGIKG